MSTSKMPKTIDSDMESRWFCLLNSSFARHADAERSRNKDDQSFRAQEDHRLGGPGCARIVAAGCSSARNIRPISPASRRYQSFGRLSPSTFKVSQYPCAGASALDGAVFRIAVPSFTSSNMAILTIEVRCFERCRLVSTEIHHPPLGIWFSGLSRLRLCHENPGKMTGIYS